MEKYRDTLDTWHFNIGNRPPGQRPQRPSLWEGAGVATCRTPSRWPAQSSIGPWQVHLLKTADPPTSPQFLASHSLGSSISKLWLVRAVRIFALTETERNQIWGSIWRIFIFSPLNGHLAAVIVHFSNRTWSIHGLVSLFSLLPVAPSLCGFAGGLWQVQENLQERLFRVLSITLCNFSAGLINSSTF